MLITSLYNRRTIERRTILPIHFIVVREQQKYFEKTNTFIPKSFIDNDNKVDYGKNQFSFPLSFGTVRTS